MTCSHCCDSNIRIPSSNRSLFDAPRGGRIITTAQTTATIRMQSSRRDRKIFYALCANAAVLVMILLVLLGRDNRPLLASPAFADAQAPVAGGGGLFVMPGQLSPN